MRWLRFVLLLLIVTMLQADMVDIIAVPGFNIKPDLLLILLVFFATNYDMSEAIIASFIIGFAADIIVVGSSMGPRIISFGLFGSLLTQMHQVMAIRKMRYQSLAVLVTGILAGVFVSLLTFLKGQSTSANIYSELFGIPLYSAILGPFLFLPLGWWMRIKTKRSSRV